MKRRLYPNQIKIRNFARRRLELETGDAGAEAAQLKQVERCRRAQIQWLSDAAKNESSFNLGIQQGNGVSVKGVGFLFATILFLAFSANCSAYETNPRAEKKTILLTVPKSGTHMIMKAMMFIMGPTPQWIKGNPRATIIDFDPKRDVGRNSSYVSLGHTFSAFNVLKDYSSEFNFILLIRDPRDVLISEVEWMASTGEPLYWTEELVEHFHTLTYSDQLTFAMMAEEGACKTPYFLDNALGWIDIPELLVLRFEDLVGPNGGGDKQRQRAALKAMASQMGYELTTEEVDEIAKRMYGRSWTFNSGKIGRWQKIFTEEHKKLFKMHMGQYLVDFGYEKDFNW